MDVELVAVLILGLAFAVVAFEYPSLALFGFVFALFTRAPDALAETAGTPSLSVPLALVMIGAAFTRWWVHGESVVFWRAPALLITSFGVLAGFSVMWADVPDRTVSSLVEIGKLGVFVMVAFALVDSPARVRVTIWAIISAAGMLGALALLHSIGGGVGTAFGGLAKSEVQHIAGSNSAPRAAGPSLGANGLAQVLLISVPLAVERLFRERHLILRATAALFLVAASAGVYLTYSRQALLAGVAMGAVWLFRTAERPWRVALICVAMAIAALLVAPSTYTERIESLSEVRSVESIRDEPSFEGRFSEYIVGLQMFRDNPVLGVGWANYEPLYQGYSRELGFDTRRGERGPHSTYLELASELGIVGLAWLGLAFTVAFGGLRRASRMPRPTPLLADLASMSFGLEVAVVGFAITSALRHLSFPFYFWLVLGFALVVGRIAEQARIDSVASGLTVSRYSACVS